MYVHNITFLINSKKAILNEKFPLLALRHTKELLKRIDLCHSVF